jgi:polar amino acid transport system permease protein
VGPRIEGFLADTREFLPILAQGLGLTVLVTLGALVLSTGLGLVWAVLRVSGVPALAWTAVTVVNLIRGIPIIVQLFFIYFVLPEYGVTVTAVQAAIIGLGVAYSAYQAENFRAGIEAIERGQVEAAMSLGLRWWPVMRRVILPQAVRIVLPPYGNVLIMLLKDSSQASTITVAELTLQGKLIASSTFKNTSVFTLVALLYLAMSLPLMWAVDRLGKRMQAGRR